MFLRNYYNILAISAFKGFYSISNPTTAFADIFKSSFESGSLSLKRVDGTIDRTADFQTYVRHLSLIPTSGIGMYNSTSIGYGVNYTDIVFGSGNTPVTFDDYTLDEPIATSVIYSSVNSDNVRFNSLTYDKNMHRYIANISITVTNKSSENVTIKEFGVGIYYYLTYREVLDEPLVVPANGVAVFNYDVAVTIPEV